MATNDGVKMSELQQKLHNLKALEHLQKDNAELALSICAIVLKSGGSVELSMDFMRAAKGHNLKATVIGEDRIVFTVEKAQPKGLITVSH